jgi:hypothetical protein
LPPGWDSLTLELASQTWLLRRFLPLLCAANFGQGGLVPTRFLRPWISAKLCALCLGIQRGTPSSVQIRLQVCDLLAQL